MLALNQLDRDGLLERGGVDFSSGLSRREIIRKVGFASMIALPAVTVLTAPNAVSAQSLTANGGACNLGDPSTCASNNCLNAGVGICCDAGSTQANSPGYNICSSDPTAADFEFRCCSGNASVVPASTCPSPGDTRYICDPY